jgi:DNA-binding protein H-NS
MARSPAGTEHLELDKMSDAELRELMQHAKDTLSKRIQERMDEFRMLAREAGFEVTLTKVGEGGERRRRRRSMPSDSDADRRSAVAPKYRNPDNQTEVWSGRGRKPKWVEEKLTSGTQLEDLRITHEEAPTEDADQAERMRAAL